VEAAEMRLGTTVERGDRPGALLALDQLLDALAVERRIGRSLPDHIVQRRRTGTHEGSLALDARVVALDAARAEIRHLLETLKTTQPRETRTRKTAGRQPRPPAGGKEG